MISIILPSLDWLTHICLPGILEQRTTTHNIIFGEVLLGNIPNSQTIQNSIFALLDLGLVGYNEAYELQIALHKEVREGRLMGALILLEHNPVITQGAGAQPSNLLAAQNELEKQGIELVKTDRGGDVTYHGPGQLVGYPIVNLRAIGSDVHGFLRLLEEIIISVLSDFGIAGSGNGPAGVWVGQKKVCSIGIAVRGGVTYHGFALNINPNLRHFEFINPCGLSSGQITSLEYLVNPIPDMHDVKNRIIEHFERGLGLKMLRLDPKTLPKE